MNYNDIISNVEVSGMDFAIRSSKYPMATNSKKCTSEPSKMTAKLAGVPTGTAHDNFLKGITVHFDLTFTVKAWTEAERYHFFDIVSSQSSIHRICKFDLSKQFIEYTDKRMIEIMKELAKGYNQMKEAEDQIDEADHDIYYEALHEQYLRVLYSCPTGLKLTAGMVTNYQQLKTIYFQRRHHVLPEWQCFCDWVETLPCFKEWIIDPYNKRKEA